MLKQSTVLSVLEVLGKENLGTTSVGVTHVDHGTVLTSNEVEATFTLQAAEVSVKNPTEPSLFHSLSFYKPVHLFYRNHKWLTTCMQNVLHFPFLNSRRWQAPIAPPGSIYMKVEFFSATRLSIYSLCDRAVSYISTAIVQDCRLLSKTCKKFSSKEDTAKQLVVMAKRTRQETKHSPERVLFGVRIF